MNDISGLKFGRLTAVREVKKGSKASGAQWECACECGGVSFSSIRNLRSGHTKSCGCLQKEIVSQVTKERMTKHGHAGRGAITPTWRSWSSTIDRCTKPTHKDFSNYGGRGIAVCDRWLNFSLFLQDMGERPTGSTIDRIDVNGNYEPGNCRWATSKQQNNNRRDNRRIEIDGVVRTASEWADLAGLKPCTVIARHRKGWSPERLLLPPAPSRWSFNRISPAHPDLKVLA